MPSTTSEFELLVYEGRALLVIDYAGAREARQGAVMTFDTGSAILEAPGQRRDLHGLTLKHLDAVSELLVAEVDPRGVTMRVYKCTFDRDTVK